MDGLIGKRFRTLVPDYEEDDDYGEVMHPVGSEIDEGGLMLVTADGQAGRPVLPEHCVCAAYKLADGKIVSGRRHHNCLGMIERHGWSRIGSTDGFLTSMGRFVTREEGRQLQDAAGIPSAAPDGYRGKTLYSEDLY
jgi:hypothetical protein